MKALITGASSGIGRDMAIELDKMGYDLILVAKNGEKLEEVKSRLKGKDTRCIALDLSNKQSCIDLYSIEKDIDILINNAGFGVFGEFNETDLEKELNMINTNITALHILTKLYLKDMIEKDNGYILNVASIAGFMPGPLMDSYYASKAYVVRLSEGIREELRRKKSNVKISVLCPGPVDTNFNNVAGVKFNLKGLSSEKVAKYAINKMFKKKFLIVPGGYVRFARILSKFSPNNITAKVVYKMQKKKI